jgi:nicotinamide-nucleotide amidase
MKAALLTIGNELLSGATVNTNASWIGQELFTNGCSLEIQLTVKDFSGAIQNGLDQLYKERPDIIIVTGGLGPTHDDRTRDVVFDYFGAKSLFDETYWQELSAHFTNKGISIPELNRSQAVYPDLGDIIPNPVGSARGFKFKKEETSFFILPGVPREMQTMMENYVLPWINDKTPQRIYTRKLRTSGMGESALAEKIETIVANAEQIEFGFFPSVYGVDIVVKGKNSSKVEETISEISKILSSIIYATSDDNIEDIIIQLLIEKGKSISTAESCTGGLVGHRLTEVSGCSNVFHGGIISYSNQIKEEQLGVEKMTLIKYGAVSKETASEMANGVRKKLKSDIGLSVTGIAGPTGGTEEKPVGLVYIGYSNKDETIVKKMQFGTNRTINKLKTSQTALEFLRQRLIKSH